MKLFAFVAISAAISCSFITPYPAESKIINVPCADGGGSGGWMHKGDAVPEHYYPMVLLGVSQMKPGQYPNHPLYHGKYENDRTKYGYCSYSTSSD